MGTRYLTLIVDGESEPIAQIGLYDGHPLSSGIEILKTLLCDRNMQIREELYRCTVISDEEYKKYYRGRFLDEEALEKAHSDFWWGDGAGLLEELLDGDKTVEIRSTYEFAYDSLMCEWAYVIDYTTNTFEVYKGFNKQPLDSNERFYHDGYKSGEYYPVRQVVSFDLASLPSVKEFKIFFE